MPSAIIDDKANDLKKQQGKGNKSNATEALTDDEEMID